MQRTLVIVHHTHWDREWYRSFTDFRFRLLRATEYIVNALQAKPEATITSFLFDGQTIVLDDIAQVASPPLLDDLRRLIVQGKVAIGPWYIMPDEFLISGEALIQNLQIGMAQSMEAGADPQVLYLPDTFGHISQLPQIAHLLGLKSIVVARGVNQPTADLLWQGPDGSRIHTHALPLWSGYYQDFIHHSDYVEKTKDFLTRSKPFARTGPVILFAGADHTMPPCDWNERLKILTKTLKDFDEGWNAVELDLNRAMASCRNSMDKNTAGTLEISGELRDNSKAYILSGIASSRSDLKLLNVCAQNLLTHQLEPLGLFAPSDFLYSRHRQFLWKTLIQNHAHDSIGGCSIDQVHRENTVRFESVIAGAQRHSRDIMRRLTNWRPKEFNNTLFFWNLLPFRRRINQSFSLQIPKETDLGSLRLVDENGAVHFSITRRQGNDGFYSEFEFPPGWNPGFEYLVDVEFDVDAFEIKEFRILPECSTEALRSESFDGNISGKTNHDDSGLLILDNQTIQVTIHRNGAIHITGGGDPSRTLEDILRPLWEPDLGDTYTSSPVVEEPYWGKLISSRLIHDSSLTRVVELVYQGPGKTTLILMPELKKGEDILRIGICLENHSEDMRLRLILGTTGRELTSQADIPLDVVTRIHRSKKTETHVPQRESYPNEWPSQSFICAGGITVYHRGLHGYDLLEDGRLALTVIRSVGMLSREALPERGGGAGPHLPTPDAQMPGVLETQIAISLDPPEAHPLHALVFNQPASYTQGTEYRGSHPRVCMDNPRIIPLAIFRPENSKSSIIIRMLNTSDSTEDLMLRITGLEQIWSVDLLGRRICTDSTFKIQGDEIHVRFGKKSLCTLECLISTDVMV